MILQEHLHWKTFPIGLAIALCFLLCLLVYVCFSRCQNYSSITTTSWIRGSSLMVLTGSLLLHFGSLHWASLLVADAIIFNMLYLTDSLSVGVMQNHVLPQGAIF